jgi:hypothetical protein
MTIATRLGPSIVLRPECHDHTTISVERNSVSDALQTLVDSKNDRLWRDVARARVVVGD